MISHLSSQLKNKKRAPLNSLTLSFTPREAAVLVPIYEKEGVPHLVLTKRTELVAHHKGQICFPGGVQDESDSSLWETALRECREEIGLDPKAVTCLGELGQVVTPTGYRVTPFVGVINGFAEWKANPEEIAEIFSVPLPHFLEPSNLNFTMRNYNGFEYQDPVFTYAQHQIWGATGRIVVDLLAVLREADSVR